MGIWKEDPDTIGIAANGQAGTLHVKINTRNPYSAFYEYKNTDEGSPKLSVNNQYQKMNQIKNTATVDFALAWLKRSGLGEECTTTPNNCAEKMSCEQTNEGLRCVHNTELSLSSFY